MPPPLHILLYMQGTGRGGVERVALRLARDWSNAGQRVTLVTGADPRGLLAGLPDAVERVVLGSDRYVALLRLPALVRARRADVIFCAGNHYTSIAAWLRLRLGGATPVLVWKISNALHRADHGAVRARLTAIWHRRHPRLFDAIVAMAPAQARAAAAALGIAAEAIDIIPNPPLDSAATTPPPPAPAHRYLLGIGRLEPQKDWPLALRAFARLDAPDLHFHIMGEGSERAALERLARDLGIAGRLHLRGHVEGVGPTLARAQALLLTSVYEGVPNVVREAVAAGTPVIATDSTPALADLLPPHAGTIVSRREPAAVAEAIAAWRARPRPAPPAPADTDTAAAPAPDAAARAYLSLFARLAGRCASR